MVFSSFIARFAVAMRSPFSIVRRHDANLQQVAFA
jgi:hypothetical protein